jgi:hypothetical protein
VQPTVTASASGGTGAAFSVSLNQIVYEYRQAWEVASVTVTSGGTGYPAVGSMSFSAATGDTTAGSASASFYCGRVAPTVTASASGSGSGASLSVSLASATGYDGKPYWYVSGISITSGGSGYAEYDQINVTVTDGEGYGAYAVVSSVDESGAITGIAVYWGGEYYKSNGIIQSVELGYGGGIYYRDDPSLPAEKANVTVGVIGPSGSGAAFTVTIDDDTDSPTFGQITAVNISNGGSGYIAWRYRNVDCCEDYYNGLSVVLQRTGACTYSKTICGTSCGGSINVEYKGPSTPATVTVSAPFTTCGNTLTASSLVTDCSSLSFTATNESGVSASVTAGGTFDAEDNADDGSSNCFSCCEGEEEAPEEVTVEVREKLQGESEWGPPYGFGEIPGTVNEVPEVVLQRGQWGILATIPGTGGTSAGPCVAVWGAPLPNGTRVAVVISKCTDSQCEDCRQCETRAAGSVVFAVPGGSNQDRGVSDACDNCEAMPMCSPKPGDYEITKSVTGSGLTLTSLKITVL